MTKPGRSGSPGGGSDKGKGKGGGHPKAKLPRLSTPEWKRVSETCYWHFLGKCELPAAECLAKYGKKHETLPKRLEPYMKAPGARTPSPVPRGKSGKAGQAAPAQEGHKERYATRYCYNYADGKCDVPNCKFDHLTNKQAKAKAHQEKVAREKAKSSAVAQGAATANTENP